MSAGDLASRLDGFRVLVTGAGSGIGRATSLRLAAEGAWVLATDRDADRASETAEMVGAAGGRGEHAELDVASESAASTVESLIKDAMGGIEGLVNNAGIGVPGSILDTSEEDWARLFSVNVDGTFRCSKAVLPHMLAEGRGSIVNMASVAGLVGLTNRLAYCATKGAVVSMTKAMALDHAGTGVRVNCVCPGTVETPWVESMADKAPDRDDFFRQMRARQPVGRLGQAEEVAAAVAYLSGPDAAFVTGSSLVVDGGLTTGIPAGRR